MKTNSVITIVGQKGSGKTVLARSLIAGWPRVVTLDWLGEYPGTAIKTGPDLAGFLSDNLEAERFRATFRPTNDEDAELGLTAMYRAGHPDLKTLIVLEEAGAYAPPTVKRDHPVIRLFRFGRHARIDVIAISQRPADLSRMITSQSDLIVAFRTQEPRDLDYLKSFFQDRTPRLAELEVGDFLTWGDTGTLPPYVHTREALRLESPAPEETDDNIQGDGGEAGKDGPGSAGDDRAGRRGRDGGGEDRPSDGKVEPAPAPDPASDA